MVSRRFSLKPIHWYWHFPEWVEERMENCSSLHMFKTKSLPWKKMQWKRQFMPPKLPAEAGPAQSLAFFVGDFSPICAPFLRDSIPETGQILPKTMGISRLYGDDAALFFGCGCRISSLHVPGCTWLCGAVQPLGPGSSSGWDTMTHWKPLLNTTPLVKRGNGKSPS